MTEKQGIILVNLGTPSEATPAGVRAFLQAFLMDKRVVGIPHLLWWPILNGIVLPLRCKRVADAYQKIWLEQGSPLLVYSQQQQKALQALLGETAVVELAMTYGQPSLQDAWARLKAQSITRVLLLPMALRCKFSCEPHKLHGMIGKAFHSAYRIKSFSRQ